MAEYSLTFEGTPGNLYNGPWAWADGAPEYGFAGWGMVGALSNHVYANDLVKQGATSLKSASGSSVDMVPWVIPYSLATLYGQVMVYVPTTPVWQFPGSPFAGTCLFGSVGWWTDYATYGGNNTAGAFITNTRQLRWGIMRRTWDGPSWVDPDAGAQTSPLALAVGWNRIEGLWTRAAGTQTIRVYNGAELDGPTPTWTWNATVGFSGGGPAGVNVGGITTLSAAGNATSISHLMSLAPIDTGTRFDAAFVNDTTWPAAPSAGGGFNPSVAGQHNF